MGGRLLRGAAIAGLGGKAAAGLGGMADAAPPDAGARRRGGCGPARRADGRWTSATAGHQQATMADPVETGPSPDPTALTTGKFLVFSPDLLFCEYEIMRLSDS